MTNQLNIDLPLNDQVYQCDSSGTVGFCNRANKPDTIIEFGNPSFWQKINNGTTAAIQMTGIPSEPPVYYQLQCDPEANHTTMINKTRFKATPQGNNNLYLDLPFGRRPHEVLPGSPVTFQNWVVPEYGGGPIQLYFSNPEFICPNQDMDSYISSLFVPSNSEVTVYVSKKATTTSVFTCSLLTTNDNSNYVVVPQQVKAHPIDLQVNSGSSVTFQSGCEKPSTIFFTNPSAFSPACPELSLEPGHTHTLQTTNMTCSTRIRDIPLALPAPVEVPRDVSNPSFVGTAPANTEVTFTNTSNASKTVYFRNPNVWQNGVASVQIPGSSQKTLITATPDIFTEMSLKEDHWKHGPHAIFKVTDTTVYATITVTD